MDDVKLAEVQCLTLDTRLAKKVRKLEGGFMSYDSIVNTPPDDPLDIVEELILADGIVKNDLNDISFVEDSLYLRAAKEIQKLRRIVGIVEN